MSRREREEEVLAMTNEAMLAISEALCEADRDVWHALDDAWTEDGVSEPARSYLDDRMWNKAVLVVRRSIPVAVVGMKAGWDSPVVVHLPGAEGRDELRVEVERLREEVVRLRSAAVRAIAQAQLEAYEQGEEDGGSGRGPHPEELDSPASYLSDALKAVNDG